MSTAVEGAQGKNDCPVGCVGALMVGLLGVGKGVLVGVRDWGVMVGWDGGHCPPYDYYICRSSLSYSECEPIQNQITVSPSI